MSSPTVIYIAGAGRSGSTVLDTALGNYYEAVSVGELINASIVLSLAQEYCACGERASECTFWKIVVDYWRKHTKLSDLAELAELQHQFEYWKRLPFVIWSKVFETTAYLSYVENMELLYEGVARASGKKIIVDSSKNPVRAYALASSKKVEMRVIHLVRDGRGVAWSLLKNYRKDERAGIQHDLASKPVWRTAIFWSVMNAMVERYVRKAHSDSITRIRYEDFVSSPEDCLRAIHSAIGKELSRNRQMFSVHAEMSVGHVISGNRLRMNGVVKIRPDREWEQSLTPRQKRTFGMIAGRYLRKYGYV